MVNDAEGLKGLDTCEFLAHSGSVLLTDHINNLEVKELRLLLCYYFRSEKLMRIPNKVELVEAVTNF